MMLRKWLRPPRHVLTVFLIVAIVSAAALAWLAWLLLEQDNRRSASGSRDLHTSIIVVLNSLPGEDQWVRPDSNR